MYSGEVSGEKKDISFQVPKFPCFFWRFLEVSEVKKPPDVGIPDVV